MLAAVSPELSPTHTDRPQPVAESDLRLLCTLVSRGCSIKEAARYVGCALSEIRRERETNEWFRRKLARAKMKANLAPIRAMQQAMLKDWRAAAWFLERTQPEKFGRRNHRAFTQKQANALIKDITSIVGEEVASEIVFNRLSSRIEAAVRYACHAHNDMNRTAAELGHAMRHHDMKSPRYSPALAKFSFTSPSGSGASEFTRRGENRPPRAPATHAPHSTPSRPTTALSPPPASPILHPQPSAPPTGRTIAQSIVDSVDKQFATVRNATPPPAASPPNPRPATQNTDFPTGSTDCRPNVIDKRSSAARPIVGAAQP
jgi:hypothetical protein